MKTFLTSAAAACLTLCIGVSAQGNALRTYAYGIDGGNIVGYYRDGSGDYHGFSYDGSTYTPLDVPGASDTYAFGIDGDHIVGQYYSGGNVHGFLHDDSVGTSTVLDMPGVSDTRAFGIDGSNIVGWYYNVGSYHGFLHDSAIDTYMALDVPDASNTYAQGIDGSNIVGYYKIGSSYHGFLVSIPEPGTLSLLALGGLMVLRRRRGTRWRTR